MEREIKELIISNKNLIYSIANKFRGDIEDLFQVGCIGLINAYYNYDESKNTKFITYAYKYIYGEIYKYAISNKSIKVSPEIIKLNQAITKAQEFLCQKFKREPLDIELANFLEIPVYKLVEARNALEISSLDDTFEDNDLYNFIPAEEVDYDEMIVLKDAMEKLNNNERELILKRYFYNMTQSQIAKLKGINQVKVSREEEKVLTKLRSYM